MTPRTRRPEAALRHIAVLTLLAFGCATVRVPASTISGTVPVRDGVAEPQLELWLESGREVSPAESAQASAQARDALRSALAGVSAPQGDAVLVVRAQGVARTDSRRSDQRAAVAGLVVGAVVVVAAVVAVLVASNGKGFGGGPSKIAPARGAPAPRPAVPAPRPVAHAGGGARGARFPVIDVNVFAGVQVPPPAEHPEHGEPAAVAWEEAYGWGEQSHPPPGGPSAAQPPAPAEGVDEIALPPPPPLALERRGFFQGDMLRLEIVVADRRDGTPIWTKVVEGDVDPRDGRAVQGLLARALGEEDGWMPASPEIAGSFR